MGQAEASTQHIEGRVHFQVVGGGAELLFGTSQHPSTTAAAPPLAGLLHGKTRTGLLLATPTANDSTKSQDTSKPKLVNTRIYRSSAIAFTSSIPKILSENSPYLLRQITTLFYTGTTKR